MTRILLQYLNFPFFVVLAMIGVGIQSSLFNSFPLVYIQPDLILICVIWCGLHRGLTEGGILTLIFAYICEVHSGAPQGLYFVNYMVMYLATRLTVKLLVIPNRSSLVLLTLGASIISKLIVLYSLSQFGGIDTQWRHFFLYVFPGAAAEGVAAMGVYRLLERFDWFTYKDERARKLLEDELLLEGEGF